VKENQVDVLAADNYIAALRSRVLF